MVDLSKFDDLFFEILETHFVTNLYFPWLLIMYVHKISMPGNLWETDI